MASRPVASVKILDGNNSSSLSTTILCVACYPDGLHIAIPFTRRGRRKSGLSEQEHAYSPFPEGRRYSSRPSRPNVNKRWTRVYVKDMCESRPDNKRDYLCHGPRIKEEPPVRQVSILAHVVHVPSGIFRRGNGQVELRKVRGERQPVWPHEP